MTFSEALNLVKEGKRLFRAGWNGRFQEIEIMVPDAQSVMTVPYIFIRTVTGDLVPWVASQTDMLSEDWFAR